MPTFPIPGYQGQVTPHWGNPAAVGGSDLFAPRGTPIVNIQSGTITFVGSDPLGGNAVQVHGDDGLDYYYAHLNTFAAGLAQGARVAEGDLLGTVGNTGDAASGPPHLHIGIGRGIQLGTGPFGGIGKSFDAVSFLRSLLASPLPDKPPANVVTSPAPKQNPSWLPDPITPIVSSVGGVIGTVTSLPAAIVDSVNKLIQFGDWLGQPHLVLRLALLPIGLLLVLVGLVTFAFSFTQQAGGVPIVGAVPKAIASL